MAVAFGTSNPLAIGTRTNSTFTAPASIANGDLLMILMSAGASAAVTVTAPSGWSTLSGGPLISISKPDPFTTRGYVFYKIASGESGNYATGHSSASTDGIICRWTGHDPAAPFNPSATVNNGTGGAGATVTVTATGLTTAVNDSGVVFFTVNWDGQNGAAPTGTTPTFTERFDSGAGGNSYAATGVLATAGATGDKSNSANGSGGAGGNPWAAALIAIAAPGAAAVGPVPPYTRLQAVNRAGTY